MSVVAYSIGKAPRCKNRKPLTSVDEASKKARDIQSGPGTYEITMIDKKRTP